MSRILRIPTPAGELQLLNSATLSDRRYGGGWELWFPPPTILPHQVSKEEGDTHERLRGHVSLGAEDASFLLHGPHPILKEPVARSDSNNICKMIMWYTLDLFWRLIMHFSTLAPWRKSCGTEICLTWLHPTFPKLDCKIPFLLRHLLTFSSLRNTVITDFKYHILKVPSCLVL